MGNCLDSCFKSSSTTSPNFTCSTSNPNSSLQDRSFETTTTTTTTSISSSATAATSSHFSAASGGIDSESPIPSNGGSGQILDTPRLKVYSLADLKTATKNFKPNTLLGEGGFGKVFKGWVDEHTLSPTKPGFGMVVAIKRLNDESVQGFEEWQAEVNFLGRLSHPNLVKLLGYCWEDKDLLLVYEFMEKGSLESHLFRRTAMGQPLPWDLRLKIAIGAARGLAFLHASENQQVIYRDFKASNILLDANFNAKISDFGLAKLGPAGGQTHVTTRVMGTSGYAAPEYIATGHLYVKSDVYGFGVVLLELLTGLRAMDRNRQNGEQNLVDWLKPTLSRKRKVKNIMDVRMEGQYSSKAMLQAADITLKCLEPDPRSRPSMTQVVEALQQVQAITNKPNSSSKSSASDSNRSTTHRLGKPLNNHHYSSLR